MIAIVEKVAKDKKFLRSKCVSNGWWRRFLDRQPQLSLRHGDSTAHVRMDCTNRKVMENYYELLEDTLKEHNLSEKPAHIYMYNMDESGMPLDPCPPNVVTRHGLKKVCYRSSGKKEQITIIGCVNAVGTGCTSNGYL